jgi:3-isopropylmalate/(R)-2-methylmalate dehydratase small subunit
MEELLQVDKFETLVSKLIPLSRDDIDTDQIIPARYLKVTDKAGLAEGLFCSWRYLSDGSPDPGFILNNPIYSGARILLTGDNFGCGSSREHAPWALAGWGIRAIISTSFADIFRNNAMKNGLLPVIVPPETLRRLFLLCHNDPSLEVTIDLASQTLKLADDSRVNFPIDAFHKTCMLEGLDPLQYLLRHAPEIEAYKLAREIAS